MADALERMTNLLALLLEARRPLTAEQIVAELADYYSPNPSAARTTFERDKALMRELGIPISTEVLSGGDAGRTAYSIDRAHYELRDLRLSEDEQHALQMAVAATRMSQGEFGLLKLGGSTEGGTPFHSAIPELAELPTLREAIADRRPVSFTYRGTTRHLHPYGLLLRAGQWYVVGEDLDHAEQRTYRVDRIEGGLTAGEPGAFDRPQQFSAADAFPADPKELGEDPQATAEVRFDASRGPLARRQFDPHSVISEGDDGSVVVRVPCANVDAFRTWLFSWGEHAEVLSPPALRASIGEWLDVLSGGAR